MITIVAVGKKHEDWIVPGLERYQKRLRQPFDVQWVLLPHSSLEGTRARHEESERIISRLGPSDFIVLLDETGKSLDSPALAELLHDRQVHSQSVTFVIGGAYGVNDELKQRANMTVSLSRMVFPHQLVRLILLEQLYRCQEISRGSGYHHS